MLFITAVSQARRDLKSGPSNEAGQQAGYRQQSQLGGPPEMHPSRLGESLIVGYVDLTPPKVGSNIREVT